MPRVEADVAEIKVDSTQSLSKLELADDNTVQIGQKIILLGYPGVSQETIGVQQSTEGGRVRDKAIYIPEPTVTEGIIAKMPTKNDRQGSRQRHDDGTAPPATHISSTFSPGPATAADR